MGKRGIEDRLDLVDERKRRLRGTLSHLHALQPDLNGRMIT